MTSCYGLTLDGSLRVTSSECTHTEERHRRRAESRRLALSQRTLSLNIHSLSTYTLSQRTLSLNVHSLSTYTLSQRTLSLNVHSLSTYTLTKQSPSHNPFTSSLHITRSHHLFTSSLHIISSHHLFTSSLHIISSHHLFTSSPSRALVLLMGYHNDYIKRCDDVFRSYLGQVARGDRSDTLCLIHFA